MKQSKLLLGICLAFFGATTTFAQGWKTDINFLDVGNATRSHIYKGVIDEDDHTYLFLETYGSNGYQNTVREFLPDGSSGFVKSVATGTNPNFPIHSHFGGGIDTDDDYVYYTKEFHPSGSAGMGNVEVAIINKSNPNSFHPSIVSILGDFYVTSLVVKENALYLYGFTEGNNGPVEFIDPGQPSTFLTKNSSLLSAAFVAKYDLSNGINNSVDLLWAKSVYQTTSAWSTEMEVDALGRIYLGAEVQNGATIMNTSSTINFSTGASTAGSVLRLDSNGNFDATWTPVVVSNPTATGNGVAFFTQAIDDLALEESTNSLYFTSKQGLYCNATNMNHQNWSKFLPNQFRMRLAVSQCDELYTTGLKTVIVPSGSDYDDSYYFAQSYDKSNGNALTTLSSSTYGNGPHSEGEIILIQSDGDKVIAGDYDIGTTSIAIDYDHTTASANPTFPVVTYSNYSISGSFVGVYDDGVAGDLIIDYHTQDANGTPSDLFYCDEAIIFNGLASQNETNHFIGFNKRPIGSTGAFTWHGQLNWLGGPAGISNLRDLANNASQPFDFPDGYEYQILVAVSNDCIGWMPLMKTFKVEKRVISGHFSSVLNLPYTNTSGNQVFDLDVSAAETDNTLEHRWFLLRENANGSFTLVQYVPWSTSHQSYSFVGIDHGVNYRVTHFVRDPSGCADEQSAFQDVGQFKSATSIHATEEVPASLKAQIDDYLQKINAVKQEDLIEPLDFKLFPNPAQNYAVIENTTGKDARVTLLTSDGRSMERFALSSGQERRLDVHSLAEGVYIVQMTLSDETSISKRLVKH